ncbi:collagen alpha-3(IX) chain-like isoform X2 [Bacillus rossius redtenbacheri]|uniref:collagen alpha-3(IX) chain-like isoform X2 n=1 Tax=Bacillus rossius redtenbacheri TaxID=93214 RepID=UPI002FDE73C3
MNFIAIVVMHLVSLAVLMAKSHSDPLSDAILEEWESFKMKYGKKYSNKTEEKFRLKVFLDNWRKITKHNDRYERGEVTFKMGMNKYGDLAVRAHGKAHGRAWWWPAAPPGGGGLQGRRGARAGEGGQLHRPRQRGAAPRRGLEAAGRRHARGRPGALLVLLGLQRHGRAGGPDVQEDRQAGAAERAEPRRLFAEARQPRLLRRFHEPGLPVRQREPRPGHRPGLPVHRPGGAVPLPARGGRRQRRGLRGAAQRQRGPAAGGRGHRGPRVRVPGRRPRVLPLLPPGRVLRATLPEQQHRAAPRGAGGRLRHGPRRQGLLDPEELLGDVLGTARLHALGPRRDQPLRGRHSCQLPAGVADPPTPTSSVIVYSFTPTTRNPFLPRLKLTYYSQIFLTTDPSKTLRPLEVLRCFFPPKFAIKVTNLLLFSNFVMSTKQN